MLILYVGDFKMAGPKEPMAKTWKVISDRLSIDEPEEANLFLGCKHELTDITLPDRTEARQCVWNMEEFMTSTCDKYIEMIEEIKDWTKKLTKVDSPFEVDNHKESESCKPNPQKGPCLICKDCDAQVMIKAQCEFL